MFADPIRLWLLVAPIAILVVYLVMQTRRRRHNGWRSSTPYGRQTMRRSTHYKRFLAHC